MKRRETTLSRELLRTGLFQVVVPNGQMTPAEYRLDAILDKKQSNLQGPAVKIVALLSELTEKQVGRKHTPEIAAITTSRQMGKTTEVTSDYCQSLAQAIVDVAAVAGMPLVVDCLGKVHQTIFNDPENDAERLLQAMALPEGLVTQINNYKNYPEMVFDKTPTTLRIEKALDRQANIMNMHSTAGPSYGFRYRVVIETL